jgi:hypothetical protein
LKPGRTVGESGSDVSETIVFMPIDLRKGTFFGFGYAPLGWMDLPGLGLGANGY